MIRYVSFERGAVRDLSYEAQERFISVCEKIMTLGVEDDAFPLIEGAPDGLRAVPLGSGHLAIVRAPGNFAVVHYAGEKASAAEWMRGYASARDLTFAPEDAGELRRFLQGDLERWMTYPDPLLVGDAWKEFREPVVFQGRDREENRVVAMHRARTLADRAAKDRRQVLLVEQSPNGVAATLASLDRFCPHHLKHRGRPRTIDVTTLDDWASGFLASHGYDVRPVSHPELRERADRIWDEVLRDRRPSNTLLRAARSDLRDIVLPQGMAEEREYLRAPRYGSDVPLDREKRKELWNIFGEYRARLLRERMAEPEDVQWMARQLFERAGTFRTYASVVVHDMPGMTANAARLLRAVAGDDGPDRLFVAGGVPEATLPLLGSVRVLEPPEASSGTSGTEVALEGAPAPSL